MQQWKFPSAMCAQIMQGKPAACKIHRQQSLCVRCMPLSDLVSKTSSQITNLEICLRLGHHLRNVGQRHTSVREIYTIAALVPETHRREVTAPPGFPQLVKFLSLVCEVVPGHSTGVVTWAAKKCQG